MATKKTSSTRKTSSSGRGGSRKKKPTKKEQQAKAQLYAIVLFALGILLFCFAIIPGESAWRAVHDFLLLQEAGIVPVVLPGEVLPVAVFADVVVDGLHEIGHNNTP